MFMIFLMFVVFVTIFLLAFSVNLVETQSVNIVERFSKFVRIVKLNLTGNICVL